MKRKLLSLSLAVLLTVGLSACYSVSHTVGNGAQGSSEVTQRQ